MTAPAALAGTATHSGSVTPFVTTPTVSAADRHQLNLSAGETITDATVTWSNPNADVDIVITEPGGSCEVLPSPDLPCLVESAPGTATAAACLDGSGDGENVGFGPGTESTSNDAGVAGEYSVWVLVSTGIPNVPVTYDLSVTTTDDGAQGIDDGPRPFNLLRSSGHCRGL